MTIVCNMEMRVIWCPSQEEPMASDKGGDARYSAPALEKGLDIIELLSTSEDELSLAEIATNLNRSPNEIFRMAWTLVDRGYLNRNPSNDRYSLSLKLYATALKRPPLNRLLQYAVPKMRDVTRQSWQSCHLGMEDNGDIVVVASVSAPGNWGLALRTGSVIGLGNTGTGRVLAAFRDSDDLVSLLASHRLATGEPAFNRADLERKLPEIRARGYEIAESDTTVGVTNLAFPVFDHFGNAMAVVNCPFIERKDEFAVPSLEEVVELYSALADTLTGFFTGNAARMGG